ncbi:sulfotransferase domain-containing protein [Maioricimonas sp. JC845]|uniref:sulfotransferase domain-containing protein n=1 Tax=Maioricimonas sp. JC845 TaxID=3232138 RepID=UPI0034599D6A
MRRASRSPFRTFSKSQIERIRHRLWLSYKTLHWSQRPIQRAPQTVFIVGCQRSGTTLLGRLFEKDLRTTVLYEDSCLTGHNGTRLRLKPLDEVQDLLSSTFRTPLVIAKPLVESQRTDKLLDGVPHTKALWMYRDYRDVARSRAKRFKSNREHVKAIIEGTPESWRNERISPEVRGVAQRLFDDSVSEIEAAAIIWYARNSLYFELGLDHRDDASLCKYEHLITDPEVCMDRVYRSIGCRTPPQSVTRTVDRDSLGLGASLSIRPEIAEVCEQLQKNLDEEYGGSRKVQPSMT